jgi:hydrogenase nickel incorporation protein HypA/HybF
VLSIETTEVIVSCLSCGAQSRTAPNRLLCSACGGYRTRIVAGDELRLRRVELRAPSVRSTSVAA